MINWLKRFHNAAVDYDRIDKRVPLLSGAMLLGLLVGQFVPKPIDMPIMVCCVALGIFNVYLGFASRKFTTKGDK